MAAQFLTKGWNVVGTVRAGARTKLHELAEDYKDRLEVETLDINQPGDVAALRNRLSGRSLDMLFVNAGITTHDGSMRLRDVATEEFVQVMTTNALSPMRAIEALEDLVPPNGLIGVMSSGQGSIANNGKGDWDTYRSSKAALNMLMRGFAARQAGTARALVLMAPGWARTGLGGPDAPFGAEEVVPSVVDVLISRLGTPGLSYLDRFGQTVPW